MGILGEKSKVNLSSAQLLISNNYFTSSVHCAYYSCFQRSKEAIIEYTGQSSNQINDAVRLENENRQQHNPRSKNISVHNYVIDTVTKQIKIAQRNMEARTFSRKMEELRKLRNDSDYEEKQIDINISGKAIKTCNEILEILNDIF
jgi:uncharacterized protein (UPF0332 family)